MHIKQLYHDGSQLHSGHCTGGRPVSTQGAGQARVGVARAVDGVLEVHGHHRFADSNRQAAELRAFPQGAVTVFEFLPAIIFSPVADKLLTHPAIDTVIQA